MNSRRESLVISPPVGEHPDYGVIIHPTTRVLSIGENHSQPLAKQTFKDALIKLKYLKLGFTHVGMEMFTRDMQPLLDLYITTGYGRDLLDLGSFGRWYPDAREDYLSIVDTAKDLHMRVMALNSPDYPSRDPEKAPDRYMAHVVDSVLRVSPDYRMITITGMAHTYRQLNPQGNSSMSENINRSGFPVVSVSLTGRNYPLS